MKSEWKIIFLIFISIIFVILLSVYVKYGTLNVKNLNFNSENNLTFGGNEEENKENKEDKPVTFTENNEGETNNAEILNSTCFLKQISYFLMKFNTTSICEEYEESFCIKKTIDCSVEVHNSDEFSGNFLLEGFFLEDKKLKTDGFGFSNKSFYLNSGEYDTYSISYQIESSGIDGLANKKINCFFHTLEVPEKTVCV